jgi:cell division septation protein DedD
VDANTYVTVTGVPGGTTVTGIVVKGSDAYNVYLPGALGALPWKNLHSPIAGNSGKPATISHWFACGAETTSSTTKPTSSSSSTSETTTTTSALSTTTTTSPVTTTTTAVAAATTTTTSVGTAPLAFTGFSGGWLVILAAILLLGGAALIAIPKLRARRH